MSDIVILQVSFICSGIVKAIALAASQSCGKQNTAHHQQFMPKRKALFICEAANKKCQEKVWKKGVEFEEGKKDLS